MKVIHQGTSITTTFSVIDDDGNVVCTYNFAPITGQDGKVQNEQLLIRVFSGENFTKAFEYLSQSKRNLESNINKSLSETV